MTSLSVVEALDIVREIARCFGPAPIPSTVNAFALVSPESPKLAYQRIGQKHIRSATAFHQLGPEPDARARDAVREIDISHVQTYNLGQTEPRSERQRVDQVIPEIARCCPQNGPLFGQCEGLRAQVGYCASSDPIVALLGDKSRQSDQNTWRELLPYRGERLLSQL